MASNRSNGDIDHSSELCADLAKVLSTGDMSDVTFVCGGSRFPAHRVVLATRSDYFRAMLYGGLKECRETEIELHNFGPKIFGLLLNYIYTGLTPLSSLSEDVIMDLLVAANCCGFTSLEESISRSLERSLSSSNVFQILNIAVMYSYKDMRSACLAFMDRHANDILRNEEGFSSLSPQSLVMLLSRDSFYASEIKIFSAVKIWKEMNESSHIEETELQSVLSSVRLSLLSDKEIFNVVRPSGLFTSDHLLDILNQKSENNSNDLPFRGFIGPGINLVNYSLGCEITEEDSQSLTPSCDNLVFNPNVSSDRMSIVVVLGKVSIINRIDLKLPTSELKSYGYRIEVSIDRQMWKVLLDYSRHSCRSSQKLFFEPRAVQALRISGIDSAEDRVYVIKYIQTMYDDHPLPSKAGYVVPNTNVASMKAHAFIAQGLTRGPTCISGTLHEYDWDRGYTCHHIGAGKEPIVIQLAQPYFIGSMRFRLWDLDNRYYQYRIFVSPDKVNWILVCDRSTVEHKSWQLVEFSALPVNFIKILGLFNSTNEVFHVVHFECPAFTMNAERISVSKEPAL